MASVPTAAKSGGPVPKKRPAKSSGSAVPNAARRLRLLCGWPPDAPYTAHDSDASDTDDSFECVEPGVYRHKAKGKGKGTPKANDAECEHTEL
jgi:hypothetical protein